MNDIDALRDISKWLYEMSNCGLGQTAGSPIKDILNHFRRKLKRTFSRKNAPLEFAQ
jgi:NADP-reducing hydrogenase subunit HndC